MQWSREKYLELLTFGRVERPMFVELFGPLIGLEEEWRAQGASEAEIALTAFEWDWVARVPAGGHCGLRGGCEPALIKETEEEILQRDRFGRTTRLCKASATIPLPQDYPVKTMDDWQRIRHWYTFDEDRIDWDQVEAARKAQAEGALVIAGIPGGFDEPRQLMGEEGACICYYEDPELMHQMLQTMGETAEQVLARISERLTIDQLAVHEDMAGKSGPLAGPNLIAEFIAPYYRRCWDVVKAGGGRIFEQDSDGNMNAVIDAFLDGGLTTMFPMEPAAGMDVVALRKQYGTRLAMRGGLDKHVLRSSKDAIRAELEYKIQPCLTEGGMVFGLDHRIPNGTPLENYRYYVDTGREILGLPPRTGAETGWVRMA